MGCLQTPVKVGDVPDDSLTRLISYIESQVVDSLKSLETFKECNFCKNSFLSSFLLSIAISPEELVSELRL